MAFQKEGVYQVVREGNEEILKVNAASWQYTPSVEDVPNVMSSVVDMLVSSPGIVRIVFNQRKKFAYSYDQTQLLLEIAGIYSHLMKNKRVLSISQWGFDEVSSRFYGDKIGEIQHLFMNLLRSDPIGSFVETKRILREEKIQSWMNI